MKISYKGDYAIKALLYLSAKYELSNGAESYIQLADISKENDIPVKFLEQILLILKNAGHVKSHRGKNGGYAMAKDPGKVKLGEIIRLIDGPISPIACVSRSAYKYCDFENRCVLQPIWAQVGAAVSGVVDNITFRDLAERERERVQNRIKEFAYEI